MTDNWTLPRIYVGVTVAWFSWATGAPGIPQEVSISEDAMSASCEGYEHRVVLSSVGFSRGVHYWELTIDRYHSDTDPAFGIARADVSRDQMLGKLHSWIRRAERVDRSCITL